MDFGTVRKKLTNGAYGIMELFEVVIVWCKEMALIRKYNAPDTIYFSTGTIYTRVAKKNFENLRQDSDDNEAEPKVVRRGRPPSENFKKSPGRPSLDLAGSEFPTGGTLLQVERIDLQRSLVLQIRQDNFMDPAMKLICRLTTDLRGMMKTAGSILKGKHSKKHLALDENRRNTYKQFHPSAGGRVPSVADHF
ncbi:hypothetical protein NC653_023986 [Populus alba x Populus x berolinensis]|uniref:Uncharacterized protein n=1 Tax=Populus alba x Populus x berolinensis TaxID=444605 RepID=A0AAD6QBS0_9ROSI|nr:hypothetical protein NC653_023986 [Populus alba x Populus x berolinensis]